MQVELDRCIAGDHSSPQFAFPQNPFVPLKECTSLMHNVKCSGLSDSVSYSLTPPSIGYSTAVVYNPGYGYKLPIKVDTTKACTFSFDTLTGRMELHPVKMDISNTAIRVDQWMKDSTGKFQQVGYIIRDMQLIVLPVSSPSNKAPYFKVLQGIKNLLYSCGKDSVRLEVQAMDDDNADTVTMTWEMKECYDTTARVTFKGTAKRPIIEFAWKRNSSTIRDKPYQIMLSLRDNANPLNHITQELFTVYIRDSFPSISFHNQKDTACGRTNFLYIKHDTAAHMKFAWYSGDSLLSTNDTLAPVLSKNEILPVELIATTPGGCIRTFNDTIYYDTLAASQDITVCQGESGKLSASGAYSYTWYPSTGLSDSTIANPIVTPVATTTYYVVGKTQNGCITKTDSVLVKVQSIPNPKIVTWQYAANYCSPVTSAKYIGVTKINNATYQLFINNKLAQTTKQNYFYQSRLDSSAWFKVRVTSNDCVTQTDSIYVYIAQPIKLTTNGDHTICEGDSVQLKVGGGYSYRWISAPGIANLYSPEPYVKPVKDQDYIVIGHDSFKCYFHVDTIHVKVNKGPTVSIDKSTTCKGDTVNFTTTGGHTYSWYPAALFKDPTVANARAVALHDTNFIVRTQDTITGCTYWDTIEVTVNADCVWPGDANYNGVADLNDILQIGLGLNTSGKARALGGTAWSPEAVSDWGVKKSGIDLKHADCDGNGKVEAADTLAVNANYARTHLKTDEALEGDLLDPPFYFVFEKDTFFGGEVVKAGIYIGSENIELSNIYGMAARLSADIKWIKSPVTIDYDCDLLCGNNGSFSWQRLEEEGKLACAITRMDGQNKSGYGKIGTISFTLKDSTAGYPKGGDWIKLQTLDLKAVDKEGYELNLNPLSNSVKVYGSRNDLKGSSIGETAISDKIKLYPNPAQDILVINGGDIGISRISIMNTLGQLVLAEKSLSAIVRLDIQLLPQGLYIVAVETSAGVIQKKLLIQR